jgi:adenylate cyclase class IV
MVQDLGNFIEFERKTESSTEAIKNNVKVLEDLMIEFKIDKEKLIKGSYSDLLMQKGNV